MSKSNKKSSTISVARSRTTGRFVKRSYAARYPGRVVISKVKKPTAEASK